MSVWTQETATGPSVRATPLVYDSARAKCVLFGGQVLTSGGVDGQTWEWDGVNSSWAQRFPTGAKPSVRRFHGLAYDSVRQVTVLFGGEAGATKGDTWEWNGTAWTPRVTSVSPPARLHHAMAYDPERGQTVVFGGQDVNYLGDTWVWDGFTWAQRSAGPSPRQNPAMAFDEVRKVIVLFGGADNNGRKDDTWEWDGTGWTKRIPFGALPPARASHGMASDGSCGVNIFGGAGPAVAQLLGDTWTWNGNAWAQRSSTGPATRRMPGMTYDSGRATLVLFGGGGGVPSHADTWEYPGSPCAPDLWMQDSDPGDVGLEPNLSSPLLYLSPDIWVRNNQDSLTGTSANPGPDSTAPADRRYSNEHQHQNPLYVNATTPDFVYAKVRNRGAGSSAGTEVLRMYWANASTGLYWPGTTGVWNELTGSPIPLPAIAPMQDYVVELPWIPPNPSANNNNTHVCLLGRIETIPTAPFGMAFPETSVLGDNIKRNNNIVLKNLTIVTAGRGGGRLIVRNTLKRPLTLSLRCSVPEQEMKDNFLLHGDIVIDLGPALMEKLRRGGQKPQGFEVTGKTTIRITDPERATLGGLRFDALEEQVIQVKLQLKPGQRVRAGLVFNWDIVQLAQLKKNGGPVVIGGERYRVQM